MKTISTLQSNRLRKSLLSLLLIAMCTGSAFAQITRTQMHYNALPFTTFSFATTSSNIQNGVNCSAVGNIITPSWVIIGNNNKGMPYCWGGFSTLASFTSNLLTGKSAGDNDCTTSGDCCESCALGVDCSGFVSRAWGLTTKYSTNTLLSICTTYSSATLVKQGDIFDLPGSHTRFVDTNYEDGHYLLIESSGVDWKVSYRSYSTVQLSSYTPMYYTKADSGFGGCTNKYASLPYTTSFENTWLLDSCNDGGQRIPDKYWKSDIGDTVASTDDDFWHRDDYASTDWTTPTNGAYTPAASKGTYSARFHNEPPPKGSTGALDLYVNLSPAGTKTITFDYIHNESSPAPFSFDVLLSTDGGLTFKTKLLTITTAQVSSWTTQTITTSATSATSVIRFMVTDKGTADVGIDNLNVATAPTGIQSVSNTYKLNVYPNPFNQSFTVNYTLDKNEPVNMYMVDMLGRSVPVHSAENEDAGQHTLNINFGSLGLAKGVYVLQLQTGSGNTFFKVIAE